MKKLFAVLMTIALLSIVYIGTLSMTASPMLAGSVTVSMGAFSAIMHASGFMKKGFAFETIVIPDFTPKSAEEVDQMSFKLP